MLLSAGADVSLTDDEGNTALHMAAFGGHTSIVRDLITSGDGAASRNKLGFNAQDLVDVAWSSGLETYYHRTEQILGIPLDLDRIRTERPKISKILSAAASTETHGRPTISLWKAATTGNTAAVEQHIAADTDLNAQEDFGGSTPLILTAIFGQPEAAKILIDAGADLEKRNKSGGTALHLASFFCEPEVVQLLLQAGADPSKTNNDQLTPLGVATIELTSELEFAYRYVYESLGLDFDVDDIAAGRAQVAKLLKQKSGQDPDK
ncbi:UNVERIFIED_CONTAM: hypothetical protein GTU68_034176 [Idotea baltica]|nr:hypothetical protein [Idotea baltica]